MIDLIDRQKAIDALNKMKIYRPLDSDRWVISDCLNKIVNLPSAQPERKNGRWIESNSQNSDICRLINCSECGKGYFVNINVPYENWTRAHKFCVECGAKMEVEHEK